MTKLMKRMMNVLQVIMIFFLHSGVCTDEEIVMARRFHRKMQESLDHGKQVLDRSRHFSVLNSQHSYDDKYTTTEFVTNLAVGAFLNGFENLNVTSTQLETALDWSISNEVELNFEIDEHMLFLHEKEKVIKGPSKETTVAGTSLFSTQTVTKVMEYYYRYEFNYTLQLVKGAGIRAEDVMVVAQRKAGQEIILRSKLEPLRNPSTTTHRLPITWLLTQIKQDTTATKSPMTPEAEPAGETTAVQGSNFLVSFSINRTHDDCRTPSFNPDVKAARQYLDKYMAWSDNIHSHFHINVFTAWQYAARKDESFLQSLGMFIPVLPVLEDHQTNTNNHTSNSSDVLEDDQEVHHPALLFDFLNEQRRTLADKQQKLRSDFPSAHNITEVLSFMEANLLVTLKHLHEVALSHKQSIDFVDALLREQVVAALGEELDASDFSNYMEYHNRLLFRPEVKPRAFSYAVRRSASHSPEGSIRIEVIDASSASVSRPIFTVANSNIFAALSASAPRNTSSNSLTELTAAQHVPSSQVMEISLSAASTLKFRGQTHLHGWLDHSFSGDSQTKLRLVAESRQFSSFILLVGRIESASSFAPEFGMIIQNKEEFNVVLELVQLPTAKQFRQAIQSLSPEQQEFANAFRGMQLSSTLFGICVVQIKPQLEKVLNLLPDSLTKEIILTQDLMELFIQYQIPPDLLSFHGLESTNAHERLAAVKVHTEAVKEMIAKSKQKEIDASAKKHEYSHPEMASRSTTFSSAYPTTEPASQPTSQPTGQPSGQPSRQPTCQPSGAPSMRSFSKGSVDIRSGSSGVAFSGQNVGSSLHEPSGSLFLETATTSSLFEAVLEADEDMPSSATPDLDSSSDESASDNEPVEIVSSIDQPFDLTKYPKLLEASFDKYHLDSAISPTIINPAAGWLKYNPPPLVLQSGQSHVQRVQTSLTGDALTREKSRAFDLLDALSRSGGLELDDTSLHVIIAATHRFDKSLMDTLVQGNVNPIARVEKSMLVMAATIHGSNISSLIHAHRASSMDTFQSGVSVEI